MIRITVDAEDMERIAHEYGLTVELAADQAFLKLDGIEYIADLAVAS